MEVLALDHLQIAIPSGGEAAARAFYGETLGFSEVDKPQGLASRGGLWFKAGGFELHLGADPEFRPSAKAHAALRIRSLAGVLGALHAAGAPAPSPDVDPFGRPRAYLQDPFGNRLELVEASPPPTDPPRPVLETERLILRTPAAEDFEPWVRLMGDPAASRFIGGPQTPALAWRGLSAVIGAFTLNGFSMFSVVEKTSGRWLGRLGPWVPEGWPGTEVGWGLLPEAWGKGYATEGAAAAVDYCFEVLGWTEVIHCIHEENLPSQKVAERLGSRRLRIGRLPEPISADIPLWGQSREEWRARPRGGLRSTTS